MAQQETRCLVLPARIAPKGITVPTQDGGEVRPHSVSLGVAWVDSFGRGDFMLLAMLCFHGARHEKIHGVGATPGEWAGIAARLFPGAADFLPFHGKTEVPAEVLALLPLHVAKAS